MICLTGTPVRARAVMSAPMSAMPKSAAPPAILVTVSPEPYPRVMVMSMPCSSQKPLVQPPKYMACSPEGIQSV